MSRSAATRAHHHTMPAERRKRLFAIARQEFARHGFSRASLNRILAEAGMSKSSFYHFFDDKSALFLACLEDVLGEMIEVVTSLRPETLTAETFWTEARTITERIAAMLLHHPDLADTGRMFYRSLADSASCPFIGDEAANPAARIMQAVREWLATMIRRGQALGVVRTDLDASLLTELVLATGMAVDNWALARWEDLAASDKERLPAVVLDLVMRLITTEAGRPHAAAPLGAAAPLARCPVTGAHPDEERTG